LSSRLKDFTDEAVLMLTGNVFHAEGPATVNVQYVLHQPNVIS